MILGISDLSVLFAYLLSILAMVVCIVYGVCHWNDDGVSHRELEDEKGWMQEEIKMEDALLNGEHE